jgi:hypothetical protein
VRVRVLKSIAAFDWDYQANQVVDLPNEQARVWVGSGLVEACEPETAMAAAAPERAVSRGRARRM